MNQQQTSLYAYLNIQNGLGARQLQVYKILAKIQPATNAMLSQACSLPINQITPRIYELREKGLVLESHRANCKVTNQKAIFWRCR